MLPATFFVRTRRFICAGVVSNTLEAGAWIVLTWRLARRVVNLSTAIESFHDDHFEYVDSQ